MKAAFAGRFFFFWSCLSLRQVPVVKPVPYCIFP